MREERRDTGGQSREDNTEKAPANKIAVQMDNQGKDKLEKIPENKMAVQVINREKISRENSTERVKWRYKGQSGTDK